MWQREAGRRRCRGEERPELAATLAACLSARSAAILPSRVSPWLCWFQAAAGPARQARVPPRPRPATPLPSHLLQDMAQVFVAGAAHVHSPLVALILAGLRMEWVRGGR